LGENGVQHRSWPEGILLPLAVLEHGVNMAYDPFIHPARRDNGLSQAFLFPIIKEVYAKPIYLLAMG